MTHKERMLVLKEWEKTYGNYDFLSRCCEDVFGYMVDSMFFNTISDVFEKYTKATAKLIGDADGWLDWYMYENDMGNMAMEAKAASWKRKKKIKNIGDLCRLIEADNE
jgi:hypothetical protein